MVDDFLGEIDLLSAHTIFLDQKKPNDNLFSLTQFTLHKLTQHCQ